MKLMSDGTQVRSLVRVKHPTQKNIYNKIELLTRSLLYIQLHFVISGPADRRGTYKGRSVSYCCGDDEEGVAPELADFDARIEHNEPKGTNTNGASAARSAQSC